MSGRSWSSIEVMRSLIDSFRFFSRFTRSWSAVEEFLEQDNLVVELAVLRPQLDEFITELSLVDAPHPAGPVNCSVLIHRASA